MDVRAVCVPDSGLPDGANGLPPQLRPLLDEPLGVGAVRRVSLTGERTSEPEDLLLVGTGAESAQQLRQAGAALARAAGSSAVLVAVPPTARVAAFAEGLVLGGYTFRAGAPFAAAGAVRIPDADPVELERGRSAARATLLARDLTNTRSSVKTPAWLAAQARRELDSLGVRVLERDVAWLTEQRFGGILAVGGGSAAPPRLIELGWAPRGAAKGQHIVLVGKSITYDSGGLNIKPLDSMTSMYTDMAGGAAVLAAIRYVAELKLPIRVTGLLPAAENSVSGSAMRPTDVVRHFGGRTTEIANTDAEGRLVLADALAYAVAKLKPTVLVDLATLTGAMKVALGVRTGGLFATDDALADGLLAAGRAVGEPLWRLPLLDDYEPTLASEVADANNSPGNPGGIGAALYLRSFTGGLPWAHLDIAGPARSGVDVDELSQGATGYGARLLGEWLIQQS